MWHTILAEDTQPGEIIDSSAVYSTPPPKKKKMLCCINVMFVVHFSCLSNEEFTMDALEYCMIGNSVNHSVTISIKIVGNLVYLAALRHLSVTSRQLFPLPYCVFLA